MKSARRFAFATCLLLAAGSALAANDTPVGNWKTIDDESGHDKTDLP